MNECEKDIGFAFLANESRTLVEEHEVNFVKTLEHSKTAFDDFLSKGNENGAFGFISQKEYLGDIFTCKESFSTDTARVFFLENI